MATPNPNKLFWRIGCILVAGALPVGACLENASQGPYTTWFNHHLMDKATSAALVGRPESEVESVLGSASEIHTYEHNTRTAADGGVEFTDPMARTFNYYPLPFWPFSKFQVHCHNGVVTGLEMFDD